MGIAAIVNVISMLVQTGVGKNVTRQASETLEDWRRPWWLTRRFVGAAIVLAATLAGHFTGHTATDGDLGSMVEMADKAVPYIISYGAALGIFGFTNREQ